ncbi:granzyme K-like isoform X1 [Silurus meridionalis]|nr:granzyme K-like isoform X1 [Silurus meridionalis]
MPHSGQGTVRPKLNPHPQRQKLVESALRLRGVACSGSLIVGGHEVKKPKPWMVSVQVENMHICGGTLIQKQWVLTAAHCKLASKSKPMTVLVGAHSLTKNKKAVRVKVESAYIPETFSVEKKIDDIMLLKLQNNVHLQKNKIQVKTIPKSGRKIQTGTKCEVMGWGTIQTDDLKPCDTLQELEVTVVDRELCNCFYNGKPNITEDMLCAKNKQGNKDACWGDSGGPLQCKKDIVGVVSGGNGCGNPKKPGVYTLLSKRHVLWINNKLKKHFNSTDV